MKQDIEIFGSLCGTTYYSEETLDEILQLREIELAHGEAFTGRPTTSIRGNEDHILKFNTELRLELKTARAWAQSVMAREKTYGIHHPYKTWFVCTNTPLSEYPLIGNVCPRLTPLNQLDLENLDIDLVLGYLEKMFSMCFRFVRDFNRRLDDGLSNFGVDEAGDLFYLDDDIYHFDDYMSLSQMLGILIRRYEFFDAENCTKLGKILVNILQKESNGRHIQSIISEQLKDLFVSDGRPKEALKALIAAVSPVYDRRKKKSTFTDTERREKERRSTVREATPSLSGENLVGIFADVHANLPALETILSFFDNNGIQQSLLLGDVVGYGPHPQECIDRLADYPGLQILKGNHDHAAANGSSEKGFSKMGQWAIEWTMQRLDKSYKEWLDELPVVFRDDDWIAVHGAPIDKTFFNGYVYDATYTRNLDNLQQRSIPICFHGHTHIAGVYSRKGTVDAHVREDEQNLAENDFSLVCPGSVGQSRNGVPQAQCAIYDLKARKLAFHSFRYEVESTIKDMKELGFPETLQNRLRIGQ